MLCLLSVSSTSSIHSFLGCPCPLYPDVCVFESYACAAGVIPTSSPLSHIHQNYYHSYIFTIIISSSQLVPFQHLHIYYPYFITVYLPISNIIVITSLPVKAAQVKPVRRRHAVKVTPGSSISARVPPMNLTKVYPNCWLLNIKPEKIVNSIRSSIRTDFIFSWMSFFVIISLDL